MLTPALRKAVKNAVRMSLASRYDGLAEKQALLRRIQSCTENGHIAICRSGMDCDCTQYSRVTIVPVPTLVAFIRDEDEHQQWLDGPESVWIDKPSDHDNRNYYASSDRALEAYENGHPHRVTWTDL